MAKSKSKEKRLWLDILIMTGFSVAVMAALFGILFLLRFIPVNVDWEQINADGVGWLAISYSVVFLTTSLLSLLSDKNETIYWERFTEYVLVNPLGFNFLGLSFAAFLSVVVETVAYLIKLPELYMASFFYGIGVIIALYFKMSSIYFNRDYHIRKLQNEFRNSLENEDNNGDFRVYFDRLMEYTLLAADNKNGRVAVENLSLFFSFIYTGSFGKPEQKDYAKQILFRTLRGMPDNKWTEECLSKNKEFLQNHALVGDVIFWLLTEHRDVELYEWIASKDDAIVYIKEFINNSIENAMNTLGFRVPTGREEYESFIDCIEKYGMFPDEDDDLDELINRENAYRKQVDEYKDKIKKICLFYIDNNMWDDMSEILEELLARFDLIAAVPLENLFVDPDHIDNILITLFNLVKGDDNKLYNLIFKFRTLIGRIDLKDVHYEPARDDEFITELMEEILPEGKYSFNLRKILFEYIYEDGSDDIQAAFIYQMYSYGQFEELKKQINNIIHFRNFYLDGSIDCSEEEDINVKEYYEPEIEYWKKVLRYIPGKSDEIKEIRETIEKNISDLKQKIKDSEKEEEE